MLDREQTTRFGTATPLASNKRRVHFRYSGLSFPGNTHVSIIFQTRTRNVVDKVFKTRSCIYHSHDDERQRGEDEEGSHRRALRLHFDSVAKKTERKSEIEAPGSQSVERMDTYGERRKIVTIDFGTERPTKPA